MKAILFLIFATILSIKAKSEEIYFQNDKLTLGGELLKPEGVGPFPAVLYNHGSAPGMLNKQASSSIGPLFVAKGWVFFMPYRRGQGLSSKSGKYIGDEIEKAYEKGGEKFAAQIMVELMKTQQLSDQIAALRGPFLIQKLQFFSFKQKMISTFRPLKFFRRK